MDVELMAKAPAQLIDVGVPCKKGHVVGRYAVSKKCVTCATEAALAWNEANKAKHRANVRAKAAARRAMKLQRTPAWLTDAHLADIKAFYVEAAEKTRATGISWHVDHIVPLLGKTVSGLHVPWNLQVIPGSENMRKGNRHDG